MYGFGCKGLEFKVLASRVPGFGFFPGRFYDLLCRVLGLWVSLLWGLGLITLQPRARSL